MLWYVAKLLILLPLIGAMIWGSLKLSQKFQSRFMAAGQGRRIRIVETVMLSPTQKLAVIAFHGREILVASTRHGMTRLSEVEVIDGEAFKENFRDGADFAQTLRRIDK